MRITIHRNWRLIFITGVITGKDDRNNVTRSTQCKEDVGYKCVIRRAKASDIWKTGR